MKVQKLVGDGLIHGLYSKRMLDAKETENHMLHGGS